MTQLPPTDQPILLSNSTLPPVQQILDSRGQQHPWDIARRLRVAPSVSPARCRDPKQSLSKQRRRGKSPRRKFAHIIMARNAHSRGPRQQWSFGRYRPAASSPAHYAGRRITADDLIRPRLRPRVARARLAVWPGIYRCLPGARPPRRGDGRKSG